MTYIDELKDAIRNLHGCEANHLTTVSVVETFQGETVWKGDVEIFALIDHPKAKRCFAWAHASGKDDKGKRFVTVLEIPPVDSAQKAVKVAIVEEAKRKS